MNRNDLKSMSTDELWALHEEIATRLAAALTAEKSVLENRLRRLQGGTETQPAAHAAKSSAAKSSTPRRPYPAVVPKYRNPEAAVGDLGGTRQEAPLARRTTEVRQADRRLSDQARSIGDQ
ncbi:hypothetical protein [Bradyrhizobium sp. URHC0002]